jgi:K+-sensing histidine kinase KdpD
MTAPTHVSLAGALLALVFGGPLFGVMLWMLRGRRLVSADATRVQRSLEVARLILVSVTGSNHSQRAVESACRLAEEQHAAILLVYVIEVPWTLPLDATLKQADQEARAALEAAREVAARHRVPARTVVRRARMAKDGIAAAARDHQADLVITDPSSRVGRGHPP